MSKTHYGLTPAQWRQLYDDGGWKKLIVEAAQEVADCPHAVPMDREKALAVIGKLTGLGLLTDADWTGDRSLAQYVRDVHLSILRGRPAVLDQVKREQCAERIAGIYLVGEMIHSFDHDAQQHGVDQLLQLIQGPETTGQEN